jgi:DsbC/DsbD-like thiol-disulfide interchange protein
MILAAAALLPALAAAEPQRSQARLLAGWAEPDGARVAGLAVELDPGWKTYWRAPGEAGIPPVMDWSGSDNLAAVEVEWPAPRAFDSFGMVTLGYGGAVVLPLALRAADPARPIDLRLTFDYGVCADICVPERAELALTIAPAAAPEGAAAIAAARAAAPIAAEAFGAEAHCALRGAGAERAFEATIALPGPPRGATALAVEGPEGVWFSSVETRPGAAPFEIAATAQAWLADPAMWVGRDALRLTLIMPEGAVEFRGCGAAGG